MGIYKFPMTEIPASKCMCILNYDIFYHIALQRVCIDLHFDQYHSELPIYSHAYQLNVSLNFFDFCKCEGEKMVALYYLSLLFFNYEWRGNFSPLQYVYMSSHILCPFSNGLL